jgi:hypothetical protein
MKYEHTSSRMRGLASKASLAMVLGAVLIATGCGADNPGEPRSVAERLSAPNLGSVHVYCVETANVTPTTCSVRLDASGGPTRPELRAWWLRAARALRKAGTFRYNDADWRFNWVVVTRPVADAHLGFGWRCESDAGKTPEAVVHGMDSRNPGGRHGIYAVASAQRQGCAFAPFPAPYSIYD